MSTTRIQHRACNLCEAICGLTFELTGEAGQESISRISGDRDDPFSRGHVCPKAVALQDLQNDPDRLRQPMRRTETGWKAVEWDEALDYVAEQLHAIRTRWGDDAIASYQGNPNVHNYGCLTHSGHFLGQFKTRNRFSATSVDQSPHQLVCYWMYGHQLLVPIPDIDHTDFLLMLGANPLASNGSLMTVPDVANRIKALQHRGGKLVVIDPRRTETARVADRHHLIRPGTDAALLLSLIHVILSENRTRLGRLADFTEGLARLPSLVAAFTPERVAPATGIAADTIRELARKFASAEKAACYGRMGVSTQRHGTVCQWAIQVLNLLTGNLDAVGGSLCTLPAVDLVQAPNSRPGSFDRFRSRVSQRPEVNGELPVAVLAEEMLTEGEGQVRALITIAGNPVLSTPNGRQLDKALSGLDFMVSVDLYLNETSRHAHVILPTTSPLEHDHYDLIFNHFAVRNVARYSEPLLPKPEGMRDEWEIFTALGERLAKLAGKTAKPAMQPSQIIDFGLQMGAWGMRSSTGLSLAKLRELPHGIDLGPLQPSFPQRLSTASQTIQSVPDALPAAIQVAEQELLQQPQAGLLLIGRRDVRTNNSWMHNSHRLVKGKNRCTLFIHPQDLVTAGLQSGQQATLQSRVGCLTVELEACEDMMPGTVSLPHGWGHDREGIQLSIAQGVAGVSINDLTDDQWLDSVSGNAAFGGLPVSLLAS